MNLVIRSFTDVGDLSRERIVMKASADIDVGDYAVLRGSAARNSTAPTGGRKKAYWFPDTSIKANDVVVLYTKKGKRGTKPLDNGSTAYFFYWGEDEPLWTDENLGAILLEVADWQFELPPLAVSE